MEQKKRGGRKGKEFGIVSWIESIRSDLTIVPFIDGPWNLEISRLKIAKKKLVSFFEFVSFFFSLSLSFFFTREKACDPWNEIGREGERERWMDGAGVGESRREGDNKRCKW